MRRRSRATVVVLVVLAALLGSATAQGVTNAALRDCIAHQQLTRTYPLLVLKAALSAMSPETREYSDCPDVLNRAIAAAVRPGGQGTGGGSGSFLPTPVIVILVLLVLVAATFGGIAIRRRRAGESDSDSDERP
jgi:hypothetical protein